MERWDGSVESVSHGWGSPTQWTWVWVNSGSWWWTGRPGVLQLMGLQRVRHNWATELNWKWILFIENPENLLYVSRNVPTKNACMERQEWQRNKHQENLTVLSKVPDPQTNSWGEVRGKRHSLQPGHKPPQDYLQPAMRMHLLLEKLIQSHQFSLKKKKETHKNPHWENYKQSPEAE